MTSGSDWSSVFPVSLAMTSINSARRASSFSPALCRIAARLTAGSLLHAAPLVVARAITPSSCFVVFTRFDVTVFSPAFDLSMRAIIAAPHSRFAAMAGSVSAALRNESVGIGACFVRRSWTRFDAGTLVSRASSEARKRFFSRSKRASLCDNSKTADMKLSPLAPSSSRRIRYAIATSNSAG
ncbi:unannotated protein [freshwater metagenome]|uniref:Unannotated protein n=1 Tax=freshwater metagenome TaxID=449393 RepID=A0A6J6BDU3_9ZZZZ